MGRGLGLGKEAVDFVARVRAGAGECGLERPDPRGGVAAELRVGREVRLQRLDLARHTRDALVLHLEPPHQELGPDAGRGRLVHLGPQRLHLDDQFIERRVGPPALPRSHAGQSQRDDAERPDHSGREQSRNVCGEHDRLFSSAIKRRT